MKNKGIVDKIFKENKGEKAVTLIALVITIIVLLILSAITIGGLKGKRNLITEAKGAKEATEKAQIIKEIQLKIVEEQNKTIDGKISKEKLEEILLDMGVLSNEENLIDRILTTNEGNYKIKVKDLYNGEFSGDNSRYKPTN